MSDLDPIEDPHISPETARWRRFLRERAHEIDVLTKIMEARDKSPAGSRAALACDLLTLQVMTLYVSPAAIERYRRLSPEDETRMRGHPAGCWLSSIECSMLRALEGVVASTSIEQRQHHFSEFMDWLYRRWTLTHDKNSVDWQH